MAAHRPFILTIDMGCALGYCWEKQGLQNIDLFTLYSSIYREYVVVYNNGQKNFVEIENTSQMKTPLSAATKADAVLWAA